MKVILFRKWPLTGIDDCICLSWRRDRARFHRVDTTPSNPHTVHNKWEQDKHFTLECFRRSKGLVGPAPALLNSYFVVVIHSVIHSADLSSSIGDLSRSFKLGRMISSLKGYPRGVTLTFSTSCLKSALISSPDDPLPCLIGLIRRSFMFVFHMNCWSGCGLCP